MSALERWMAVIAPTSEEAPPVAAGEASKEQKELNVPIVAPAATVRNNLPDAAPAPLAQLKGWLCWRFVEKPGKTKPDKVPFYAGSGRPRSGQQGSALDRAQLTTFDVARAAAERHGFDGVGLAMLPDWGITALDFDGCVDDRGAVNPVVLGLCSGTYSETSPSGTGVRAFVLGSLGSAKDLKRIDGFGFETFSDTGFVTLTGNALPLVSLLGLEDTIAPAMDNVQRYCEKRFSRAPAPATQAPNADADKPIGLTHEQILQVLSFLDPEEGGYGVWLPCGMALHHETGGAGFDYWDNWSANGATYPGTEVLRAKWDSFGRSDRRPVTMHSMVNRANEKGAGINLAEKSKDDFDDVSGGPLLELPAFKRAKAGRIEATRENLTLALQRPDLSGMQLRFDEFRDEVMQATAGGDDWRPFKDSDYHALCMQLERGANGFKDIAKERIRDTVAFVAEGNAFDSAAHWLDSLQWDGKPRVADFLARYFGVEPSPYAAAVSLYYWTAAAGRVLEPGTKADMVPVAVGPQGSRKSSTVAALVPSPDFFLELDLGAKDDDVARLLRGKLVVELGELKGLRTREVESLKAFITKQHEQWVPKFREMAVRYPRRCVFFGTTNKDEFLTDDTGHRRWLPFRAGACDPDAASRDRDQLWAEGAALFRHNGVMWQDAEQHAGAEHAQYVVRDPWEGAVATWLALAPEDGGPVARGFTAAEALTCALHVQQQTLTPANKDRMSRVLKELGCKPVKIMVNGKQQRGYRLPAEPGHPRYTLGTPGEGGGVPGEAL